MSWRLDDPQGAEVGKVKYDLIPYVRGRVLDIGCGPFKTSITPSVLSGTTSLT